MFSSIHVHHHARGPARRALGLVEALVAASAAAGGVYGLAGAPGMETGWLDGSPFGSYLIPSVVLLLVVGGSAALALAALISGSRRAPALAICSGAILVGWIAAEVIWIPYSPLQPVCVAAGLAMMALGRTIRP